LQGDYALASAAAMKQTAVSKETTRCYWAYYTAVSGRAFGTETKRHRDIIRQPSDSPPRIMDRRQQSCDIHCFSGKTWEGHCFSATAQAPTEDDDLALRSLTRHPAVGDDSQPSSHRYDRFSTGAACVAFACSVVDTWALKTIHTAELRNADANPATRGGLNSIFR
jgi:hypothetical protein